MFWLSLMAHIHLLDIVLMCRMCYEHSIRSLHSFRMLAIVAFRSTCVAQWTSVSHAYHTCWQNKTMMHTYVS